MATTRSPGYPSMPLSEAVDLVRKIHNANRTNPTDREAAVKDMGYTGISGRSAKVLSDLSHYGLLEKTGKGGVRVSRRAVDILYPASSESYFDAIHEAANSPTLFSELFSHFSDGVPSENSLRSYLMRNSFATAAISPIVNSFVQTCRLLEEADANGSHGEPDKSTVESTGSEVIPYAPPPESPPPALAAVVSGGRRGQEIGLMEGERVIFVEEASAGQYLKLIATGQLDDSLLEALEDFTKRQRKRLTPTPKGKAVEDTSEAAAAETPE